MAKLIVDVGGSRREHELSDPCRIGRDAENDLVLNEPGASRRHCRIASDGDGWILEDLHSANGTYKNDERIDRCRLEDGDVIRIGNSKLVFQAAGDDEIRLEDPIVTKKEKPAAAAGSGGAKSDWVLIGVTGEVKGKRFEIAGARLTVGRKNTNTVPLGDNKVSGVHCEVVLEGGRPVLRDLGSTNGTFLEGKRIDEIALSHGDRFGLGECVFVVADKREPEPELERRDADSERTMIQMPDFRRDEMAEVLRVDVEAAKRGSGALGTIVTLLLVAVLAGGGWYAMQLRGKTAQVAAAPPAAGNLLGERWSFESSETMPSPSAAWDLAIDGPEGDAREGFSVVPGRAKSGENALTAGFESGAVAALGEPLVVSGRRYTISGFARTEGEATASLAVEFRKKSDPSYLLRAVVASAQGGAYAPLEGSVAAPSDADELRVAPVATGNGGNATFDDLSVVAGGAERPPATAAGPFSVESFGDAALYRRNDETLLRVLPAVVVGADGRRFDAGFHRVGGSILAGKSGAVEFRSDLVADAKKITQNFAWKLDASRVDGVFLPIDLRGALLDHDVYVLSTSRGLEPYRDSFEVEGVHALVVGKGATRMRLSFTPAVKVRAARDEYRYALELALPAAAASFRLETQIDFVAEAVDAVKAKDDAEAAFRRGAIGETLDKLKAIRETYAFDENALAAAEALRQSVMIETDRLKKEVAAAAARARYLRSDSTYKEAIAIANDVAARLAGTDDAAAIAAEAERLGAETAAARADRDRAEASRLLARVSTALAQSPPKRRLAAMIGDHLALRYPKSEAAAEARRLLEAAGAAPGGN